MSLLHPVGGLGSSALLYLAAAGVGRLGIVDFDRVEVANLHRQVIHIEAHHGTSKVSYGITSVLHEPAAESEPDRVKAFGTSA